MRQPRNFYRGGRRKAVPQSDPLIIASTFFLLALVFVLLLLVAAVGVDAAPLVERPYLGEFCIDPATDGDLAACLGDGRVDGWADELVNVHEFTKGGE